MNLYDKEISEVVEPEDVLRASLMALVCPKGRFYPNKSFGNAIRSSIDAGELLAAARQALSDYDGVYVKSARFSGAQAVLELAINDDIRTVNIDIEQNV